VHCSRVFRSSAPSDLLPSSPGGRPSGAAPGECGSTRSMEWGVGPGREVSHRGCCPAEILPAGHIGEGTLPGPVRSQGEVARCVIQNWSHVLSAPRCVWNRGKRSHCRPHSSRPRISRAPLRSGPASVRPCFGQAPLRSGPASAGQAGRTGAGGHGRIPEFGATRRAGSPRPRPPVPSAVDQRSASA